MKHLTQSGLLLIIAVISGTATLSSSHLNFVKPGLGVPLLVASTVLLLLGAYGVWEDHRRSRLAGSDPDALTAARGDVDTSPDVDLGHDHAHGPRIGWLLVVPFLLLGVAAPPPLGSYSARADSGLVTVTTADGLPALAEGDPVDLTLAEFQGRALYDEGRSLENRRVRLVGFASPGPDGQWVLTRMSLNCCAADGFAVKVAVADAPLVEPDQWVEVVGRWRPAPVAKEGSTQLPVLEVERLESIAAPENPYE